MNSNTSSLVALMALTGLNCAGLEPSPPPTPIPSQRALRNRVVPAEPPVPVCESPGILRVTEMMIDPNATPDASSEYLELYNPGPEPVPLVGWTLRDGRHPRETLRTGHVIAAGSFAILAPSADKDANGDLEVDVVVERFTLPNRGGLIHLENPCGESIVRFRYGARRPWPSLSSGAALELRHPDRDPTKPRNWRSARAALPSGDRGSPGRLR